MLASLRKQMRHMPNLRMYARGRPQTPQRWCSCVEKRGGRAAFAMSDFFAMSALAEGHPEAREQRLPFLIRVRRRHDADLEAAQLVDLVVVDLGEDELLAQPQSVVAEIGRAHV